MNIANSQHKIVFRKNDSYILWLSSGLNTRFQEGMYFITVFQVRGLNLRKLQYTYIVEDRGCLKFIT